MKVREKGTLSKELRSGSHGDDGDSSESFSTNFSCAASATL